MSFFYIYKANNNSATPVYKASTTGFIGPLQMGHIKMVHMQNHGRSCQKPFVIILSNNQLNKSSRKRNKFKILNTIVSAICLTATILVKDQSSLII